MKFTVKENCELTLPGEFMKGLGFSEGDVIIGVINNGRLELIPEDEAYLETPFWKEAIAKSEAEFLAGDFKVANNLDELFEDLDN